MPARRRRSFSSARLIVTCLAALVCMPASLAVKLHAYNFDNHHWITFDSATPGTLTSDVAITGLGANEYIVGIDARPATGELFAIVTDAAQIRVVRVNAVTGALTAVGSPMPAPDTSAIYYGVSFDPLSDRIRLVSDRDTNQRLRPTDGGLAATDTALAYVAGDPNAAANPTVVHISYNNAATPTLYGIDAGIAVLVRIGGVAGSPSANTGQLTTIGSLGVAALSGFGGLAVDPATGAAYAALRIGSTSVLHSVNLSTGAATAIGPIGAGTVVDGLAIGSTPNPCLDLDGDGAVSAYSDGLMLLRALLGMTGTAVTGNAVAPGAPRNTWALIRTHMNSNCGVTFPQ